MYQGIWYPTIHYPWFLLDTNLFSWTTCSEHSSGQHPSSSISKWMKCSNKCQRVGTQNLHVKTDTENKHQPFHWLFPKCILQICSSYPAGVPPLDAFPGTVWPCTDCQGLPLFVYLWFWCPLLFLASVEHVHFHRKFEMETFGFVSCKKVKSFLWLRSLIWKLSSAQRWASLWN